MIRKDYTKMNKRGTGVIFILIASILYATRYIAAAIFGSGVSSWNRALFSAMMHYVGDSLWNLSAIALTIGLIYIFSEDGVQLIKKLINKQ